MADTLSAEELDKLSSIFEQMPPNLASKVLFDGLIPSAAEAYTMAILTAPKLLRMARRSLELEEEHHCNCDCGDCNDHE